MTQWADAPTLPAMAAIDEQPTPQVFEEQIARLRELESLDRQLVRHRRLMRRRVELLEAIREWERRYFASSADSVERTA